MPKARISDTDAYFQFMFAALQAIVSTHPNPDALRSCFQQYLSALVDENLQHSVSEHALQEMRDTLAALSIPPPA